MLSREDFKDYLKQLLEIETKMHHFYKDCAAKVDDGLVKDTCLSISSDEKNHMNVVTNLINLV